MQILYTFMLAVVYSFLFLKKLHTCYIPTASTQSDFFCGHFGHKSKDTVHLVEYSSNLHALQLLTE